MNLMPTRYLISVLLNSINPQMASHLFFVLQKYFDVSISIVNYYFIVFKG